MPSTAEWIFIIVFSLGLSVLAGYFDLGVGWRRKKPAPRDERHEERHDDEL